MYIRSEGTPGAGVEGGSDDEPGESEEVCEEFLSKKAGFKRSVETVFSSPLILNLNTASEIR